MPTDEFLGFVMLGGLALYLAQRLAEWLDRRARERLRQENARRVAAVLRELRRA